MTFCGATGKEGGALGEKEYYLQGSIDLVKLNLCFGDLLSCFLILIQDLECSSRHRRSDLMTEFDSASQISASSNYVKPGPSSGRLLSGSSSE